MGGLSVPGKLMAALFQSVSTRTAGMNTIDPVSYTHLDVYKRQLCAGQGSLLFGADRAEAIPAADLVCHCDFFFQSHGNSSLSRSECRENVHGVEDVDERQDQGDELSLIHI